MVPLRVTVELSSPMQIPEHPLHLDGVLSALRVERLEKEGHPDPWAAQHELPLEKYFAPDGEWCFKASIFHGQPDMEPFFSPLSCRSDLVRIAQDKAEGLIALRASKANNAGGAFRTGMQLKPMVWMRKLHAYAIGDILQVRDLLKGLKFVGPGRSRGSGRVRNVRVESDGESMEWARRALPSGFDLALPFPVAARIGPLRAPYWKKMTVAHSFFPVEF